MLQFFIFRSLNFSRSVCLWIFILLSYVLTVSKSCFHHLYMLEIFLLVQLPMRDSDIEERILRHLAAAASMRRAHHLGRRESQRTRSSGHGNAHSVVYSTQPRAPPSATGAGSEPAAIPAGNPSAPLIFDGTQQSSPQQRPLLQTRSSSSFTSGSTVATTNLQGVHSNDG